LQVCCINSNDLIQTLSNLGSHAVCPELPLSRNQHSSL